MICVVVMKENARTVIGVAFLCHALVSAAFGRTVPAITITPENQAAYGFSITVNKGAMLHPHQEIFFVHVECPASAGNAVFGAMGMTVSDKSHVIASAEISVSETNNVVRGTIGLAEDQISFVRLSISYHRPPSPQPPQAPDPAYVVDLRAYFAKVSKDHNPHLQPTPR